MSSLFTVPLVLQLLVVVTPDWNSVEGFLYCFERTSPVSSWEAVGIPRRITVGKNGMAWGKGLHKHEGPSGKEKVEGDGKAPAGIFSLGPVFGDLDHQVYAQKMPYLLIEKDLECVDDISSIHYNQFVNASTYPRDWNSSEKMQEIGDLYSLGMVIGHNLEPITKGSGSCIFMHIWREASDGTAGCTAMNEQDLKEIVFWLDQRKKPTLIQLPIFEYESQIDLLGLPSLNDLSPRILK